MPSLYKRKDNRSPYWYISLSKKEQLLLGKSQICTKEKNKRKAEIILKQVKAEIEKSYKLENTSIPRSSILLSEAFETFIKHKNFADSTIEACKKAINHFYEVAGNKTVSEYTKEDFIRYIEYLYDKNLSKNTVSIFTHRMSSLFSFLEKEEIIEKNIAVRIEEEHKLPTIPTDEEIKELLKYSRKTKFYLFVKFQILSAFRAFEVLNMKYSDIDLAKRQINVKGKGSKYSYIPITSEMEKFLKEELLPKKNSEKDAVFNFKYIQIRKFLQRASKHTGTHIRTHQLRKYTLSKLANSGVNVYFVKNYARHSDIKTTLKYYVKVDAEKLSSEIDSKVDFNSLF